MKLTRKLMFAIEAVLDIAYNAAEAPVQSKDIATRQGIPRRYLEQVLQQLVRHNVLRGVRGPRGGYRLARERRRITLAEIARVVAAIEGGSDPAEETAGSELGKTVLAPIWRDLEEEAMKKLDSISIEDLVQDARAAGVEADSQAQPEFDFMI